MAKAPQQTEYFPVYYIEPFEENNSLLGYNVASDLNDLEAMEKARDTRTAVATGKIKLPLKPDNGVFYKIFLPCYLNDVPLKTVEERRKYFMGFIVATVQIDKAVEDIVKRILPAGIDIELFDNSAAKNNRFLYAHKSRLEKYSQNLIDFKSGNYVGMEFRKTFDMAGRKWEIICRPSKKFFALSKENYHWILLFASLALTILLTIYVYTILERSEQVRLLVDERTAELNRANEALAQDITKRKRTEAVLFEQKELMQAIIDNTSAVIYLKDTAGHYQFINNQYANLFHVTKENVVGKTDYEIFPKELADGFRANDQKVIEAGHALEFEEYASHDDGIHTYISIKVPMHDSDGNIDGVYGISTDITQRKRMGKEIEKLQRLEAIGILSGGIAHDFNNLLAAILGNVSLAKMYSKPGEKFFDKLTIAENSCLQATELSNKLLIFSIGRRILKKPVEIPALLKETIIPVLDGSNITCEFSIPDNLFPVAIDNDQMKVAIKNIAMNAREAMPEGGKLKVLIETVILDENNPLTLYKGGYIKISIEDNGIGIAKESLTKIFDPYFTTKPMGSTKGMGLGLAAAYSIIKNHDGLITVDSKVGVGTTFNIYLPVSKK